MDVLGARVNFCCHSDVAIKGEIKKKKRKNPAYLCASIELHPKSLSHC